MARLRAPQRREQLLDVASELFAKQGYARATTAELAKAAGVTEPIIYRHFESKRDLFVALVERTAEQTREHWQRRIRDSKDPATRLRRLVGENPMVSDALRTNYRVFLQAITETQDAKIRKAVHAHLEELHAFLQAEVEAAQEERRVLRLFSAETIAWILVHLGLGYGVMDALKFPNKPGHGDRVQELIERMLVGHRGEE
jgi:AcrR family transcriptional regulator